MKPRAYYNEIDVFAAQWLRNLIKAGHIADGDVDERSIEDVTPADLRGYRQCHFFAGIGVWSHALRNAGWSDDREVWTGSCPCQPFSAAGKGAGFDDERHFWPAWQYLIEQCRPATVFGEQVASKDSGPWIDLVHSDMEALGYAFVAVPFPSASIGAPHIRDRLYWLADTNDTGFQGREQSWKRNDSQRSTVERGGAAGGMADNGMQQRQHRQPGIGDEHDATGGIEGTATLAGLRGDMRPGPANGFWRDADWLLCRDGKRRPVEPGTFPLAHGVANRVGRLRAYGNAINAEAARIFIESAMG